MKSAPKTTELKLTAVLYEPSESTEPDKYMAEVPALPGCRAWGDTPEETLAILQDVAQAFVDSYVECGDKLPESDSENSVDSKELVVAV